MIQLDTSREKKKQKLAVLTTREYSPLALLMGLLGSPEFSQSNTQLHKLMQLLSTIVAAQQEEAEAKVCTCFIL